LVVALAFAASGCATNQDAQGQGALLMAQMKEASGGAALDAPAGFHETGTVLSDGVASTYETWGDLHVLRNAGTHTTGAVTVARGFDGEVAWSVGPDGTVQTDASPAALASARLSAYLTIGACFYPDRFPARFEYRGRQEAAGVSYDVVTVTPAGSVPVDFWLDTTTHRLQRISGSDGDVPFSGIVERYEIVDGAWIAFALRQTAGGREMAQALTSFEFVPIPPERFAPPQLQ